MPVRPEGITSQRDRAFYALHPVGRHIVAAQQRTLELNVPTTIPTGIFRRNRYVRTEEDSKTNRSVKLYREMIFGDQFEIAPSQPIEGGEEGALGAGRTVVDLGSGEAVALFEYARLYPNTTFIGIDNNYFKTMKLSMKKPGVQLTRDDWTTLESIDDHSVDTVLSIRGVIPHGITRNNPDSEKIVDTINRITKEGAIWRFEIQTDQSYRDYVTHLLDQKGWDIHFVKDANGQLKGTIVATKRPDQSTK